MKKIIVVFLVVISYLQTIHAQKVELYGTAYTGVAGFRGAAATKKTEMLRFPPSQDYLANPFGKKPGFSAGADLQLLIPTKTGIIFNFGIGYESLATVTDVYLIIPNPFSSTYSNEQADGKIKYRVDLITLFPSLGYRIKTGRLKLDLNAGVVFAPCVKAKEEGSASSTARKVSYSGTDKHKPDFRPAVQAMLHYKKLGFVAGYQWGTRTYCDLVNLNDRPLQAMMRFLKLGLSYRIK